jgi:hypothetical protein
LKSRLCDKARINRFAGWAGIVRRGQNYWLAVVNEGAGLARDVTIELDGKPLLEHPRI